MFWLILSHQRLARSHEFCFFKLEMTSFSFIFANFCIVILMNIHGTQELLNHHVLQLCSFTFVFLVVWVMVSFRSILVIQSQLRLIKKKGARDQGMQRKFDLTHPIYKYIKSTSIFAEHFHECLLFIMSRL